VLADGLLQIVEDVDQVMNIDHEVELCQLIVSSRLLRMLIRL